MISGINCAGLAVPEGAELNIDAVGTGYLQATGGYFGAGIGGSKNGVGGMVTWLPENTQGAVTTILINAKGRI